MIIYNITFQVEWPIHDAWQEWLTKEYIPAVKMHGLFGDVKVLRLLQVDETEGPTYAVQFQADSFENYQRYEAEFASNENRKITLKWSGRLVYFSSVMSIVQ